MVASRKYLWKGLKKLKNNNINQMEIDGASTKDIFYSIIESVLYASGEPIELEEIAEIIECSKEFTKGLIQEMKDNYLEDNRGIQLISINDSFQLVTKSSNSRFVQKLLKTNIRQSLSQASLETMSIVAYRQPITRSSIDEIRGVKSDSALVTLVEKGLIKEAGRLDAPGRPIIYVTTDEFLRHFGLESLNMLPELEEFIEENSLKED